MTQLTKEEIEMIEREATELSEHNSHTQRDSWMVYDTCKITATKYLLQLKSERERAGKLMEALEGVIRVADRKTDEFDFAKTAINEYNNKP